MKQWIIGVLLVLGSLPVFATSSPSDEFDALAPEDQQLLTKIIGLVDIGLYEAVMSDFDFLAEKYPDNNLVQYERAYNLFFLGQYEEVTKLKKKLLKHKYASERAYQLIGNAYDDTGDSKAAIKIYQDGLKRFPKSGSLYLELGTAYNRSEDYNKALECYNRGILVEPNFASNYYRAAQLYLASEKGKVWGLVYAESAVLLAPSNEDRHKEMAGMIVDCLKNSISMTFGDKGSVSVKLVPGRDVEIVADKDEAYLGFPGIYEGALGRPLMKLFMSKEAFTCSLSQLIDVRRGLVENYFDVTNNLYGNSMYLLEFQKKIIEAGHWDAYNYFLFMQSFPEQFEEWYTDNSSALEEFIDWYNNEPYSLGEGRSVDPMQIFNNYHPLPLMDALMIQAGLLTDGDFEEQGE